MQRLARYLSSTRENKEVAIDRKFLEANLYKPNDSWHELSEKKLAETGIEDLFILYRYIKRYTQERLQKIEDEQAAAPEGSRLTKEQKKVEKKRQFQHVVDHAYNEYLSKGAEFAGASFADSARKSHARVLAGEPKSPSRAGATADTETTAADEGEETKTAFEEGEDAEEDDEDVETDDGVFIDADGSISVRMGAKFEGLSDPQSIIVLADALSYDAMDSRKIRCLLLSGPNHCSFSDIMILLTAAIFVGNNPARLTTKTTDKSIGKRVFAILNEKKITRAKKSSTTLTLARVGIALSPILYWLRTFLDAQGKLPDSGVVTDTPKVLQDLSLSGVRSKLPNGDKMPGFLRAMNRTLTIARERSLDAKLKTSPENMDLIADQWMTIASNGVTRDPWISGFNFTGLKSIEDAGAALAEAKVLADTDHASFFPLVEPGARKAKSKPAAPSSDE